MPRKALLLTGNLRTFFYNDNYIARHYLELAIKQDMDVYMYTDVNDFYYEDCQYFSDKNHDKIMGIMNDYTKRIYKNTSFISYEKAYKIIESKLIELFGDKLKKFHIDAYDPNLIDVIYNRDNKYHNTFINNPYSNMPRKKALLCQQYKNYKCYNLMVEYECDQSIRYDIILKSRFDTLLKNINNYNIDNLEYSKKLYCYKHQYYIGDVWALGDRFIMDKYLNYYNVISCNIYNGVYSLDGKNVKDEDSDACEYGLTYLVKFIHGYDLHHMPLDEIAFKFYDDSLKRCQ